MYLEFCLLTLRRALQSVSRCCVKTFIALLVSPVKGSSCDPLQVIILNEEVLKNFVSYASGVVSCVLCEQQTLDAEDVNHIELFT